MIFRPTRAHPETPLPREAPEVHWLVSATLPPVPLPRGRELRIGRSPSCDFVIHDRRVSRVHAEVFYKNGAPWIRDLGSHNGTLVDGERVEGYRQLRVGDRIGLHEHSFLLSDSPATLSADFGGETCTVHSAPIEVAFRGVLDPLGLRAVLDALGDSAQSGLLTLTLPGDQRAKVALRLGTPLWAEFGEARDEAALIALLARPNEGQFEFQSRKLDDDVSITRPLAELAAEASAAREDAEDPAARGLAALRAAYLQRLPDKAEELRASLWSHQAGDAEAETTLRTLAHRLHGSGGTYGLPRVSSLSRAVEVALPEDLTARANELLTHLEEVGSAGDPAPDAPAAVVASPRSRDGQVKGRVLLVDDDEDLTTFVAHRLRSGGYEVDVRHDGDEALRAFRGGGYSLCLLDVCLPGRSGFEVLEQIRAESTVPVLMLTAQDREADVVRGLELGADDYVTKPLRERELLARIQRHLKKARARAPRSSSAGALVGSGGRDELLELLQLLGGGRRSGCLFLEGAAGSGKLELSDGQLVRVGGSSGEEAYEAALKLLDTDRAEFEFVPGAVEGAGPRVPLHCLLMEAARRSDERGRAPASDSLASV